MCHRTKKEISIKDIGNFCSTYCYNNYLHIKSKSQDEIIKGIKEVDDSIQVLLNEIIELRKKRDLLVKESKNFVDSSE